MMPLLRYLLVERVREVIGSVLVVIGFIAGLFWLDSRNRF